MRISVVYNPKSGRGKAQQLSDEIVRLGQMNGHTVRTSDITGSQETTDEALCDCDRLVIVGGDGTVHHMLPKLAQTQTPFYQCGTGTANLIAREFKMSNDPARALEQLEVDCEPTRVDLPLCNGHPFLIMTSLGTDASVIHRFEETRRLGGYRSYIMPVLSEMFRPRFANVRVELDGEPCPRLSKPGVIVIANMRQYGGHCDPCKRAVWNDGLFDIAHITGGTSFTSGLRFLALRVRLPIATSARAQRITLTAQSASCIQIDGEKPKEVCHTLGAGEQLEFTISEQGVRVHAPLIAKNQAS